MMEELLELAANAVVLYGALRLVLHWRGQSWAGLPPERRSLLQWMVGLGLTLVLVTEDVLTRASNRIDTAVLSWIHDVSPDALTPLFQAVTLSASAKVLFPVLGVVVGALLVKRRYRESALLATSTLASVALVYLAKTAIQRVRPALWDTQWYWGSSFPSGHTLTAAALATAACLCIARRWPRARFPALVVASLWVTLVALSRLVLGVHWPTDVLAAICAGVLLALVTAAVLDAIGTSHSSLVRMHMEET